MPRPHLVSVPGNPRGLHLVSEIRCLFWKNYRSQKMLYRLRGRAQIYFSQEMTFLTHLVKCWEPFKQGIRLFSKMFYASIKSILVL